MPYRVFNINEVTDYLHITREDVEDLVQRSDIPCFKQGDKVVFRKVEIDGWMSQRILGLSHAHLNDYHRKTSAKAHDLSKKHSIMPELLEPESVIAELSCKTRASVIRDMVKLAEATGLVGDAAELLASVDERERMGSTALAGGVALLHPAHHEPYMFDDSFFVLGRTSESVHFGSPDGTTTDLFFLICCQDDRIHLHVLTRICMMCHYTSLLLELREAADASAMYQAIMASEEEIIAGL